MSTAPIFFNLIKDVRAKKKCGERFFIDSRFFSPPALVFEFFFQPAFFMYDASVFLPQESVCQFRAKAPLTATTAANSFLFPTSDSPQTPRLRSITTILLNLPILHIWVHLQLPLPPNANIPLERDHLQSILLEATMASDPQSDPQPRLQP